MSDDPDAGRRYFNKRVAQEVAEANEPRNRQQAQIDHWWQAQRDFEEEINDTYECSGFLERWSSTPSFTKDRRDGDWRVK